jgi:hypothetical protein
VVDGDAVDADAADARGRGRGGRGFRTMVVFINLSTTKVSNRARTGLSATQPGRLRPLLTKHKTASDDNVDTNNVETYTASKAITQKTSEGHFCSISCQIRSQALENYLTAGAARINALTTRHRRSLLLTRQVSELEVHEAGEPAWNVSMRFPRIHVASVSDGQSCT